MTSTLPDEFPLPATTRLREGVNYVVALCAIAVTYFVLAKIGLALASLHPSASPIWPPTGFALAAILLWGYRIWPAIFIAALTINAMTAGSAATAAAIASGNTLEALVGAFAINRWSAGRMTFSSSISVAKFASICVVLATPISASIGVGSLALAGFADRANLPNIWVTWWLGDLTGALVVAPVVVLWALSGTRVFKRGQLTETALVLATAVVIGLIAFSPMFEQTAYRGPLGFLAILPLLWAALRRGPRDTATASLILAVFCIWGTLLGAGPFASTNLNESFLLVLMFLISVTVPSLALSADVAMRKQSEENLRGAHAELDLQLVEAQRLANLGSWSWDVKRDRITWSDQLLQIYGLRPGEFIGKFDDFLDRVHPEDRDRIKAQMKSALESGTGFRLEERIVRPNGDIRYLQSCGEVITNSQGNVVQMLGICQDVTDRKRAEEALELAREQLAQSQKMEALGQLTGGVSHDFNNLLMIITGHVQILRKLVGTSDAKAVQALDALTIAAKRGETLTRQLLAFSRRQSLNPTVVVLRDRIEAIKAMLGSSLRGDIKFECDVAPDVWLIEIDVAELELALVNLAVNARDAMPDGGTFRLSARNMTVRPNSNTMHLSGEFVAIALSDTGVGIPQNIRARIFEPFFTTKQVGKGTGLGLSQVYGFAQQSGGGITVESEVGKGTTITIFLPRSRISAPKREDAAPAAFDMRGEGTVLVVEDDQEVADVTVSLLEQLGYRALRAENATEALTRLLGGEQIRLVLSDIIMPGGMNGIDLAEEIIRRYPKMPILLTSGYSYVASHTVDKRFHVLRKPFEVTALARAIQECVRHSSS